MFSITSEARQNLLTYKYRHDFNTTAGATSFGQALAGVSVFANHIHTSRATNAQSRRALESDILEIRIALTHVGLGKSPCLIFPNLIIAYTIFINILI